jgi:oxygen-independent coproporphyrinogen-3 oxidase
MTPPLALYIHWPFCLSKCPYCDFNSHVRATIDQDTYRAAILRELDNYATLLPERRISSIFFGGGTPSLMAPATAALLIERTRQHWPFADDCEITLEANPTSVEAANFAALAAAGVNRVSLGVQSFDDAALRFLGRQHSGAQALDAIAAAAKYFPRYSFDLIYAYAGQTPQEWEQALRAALPYTRGHMSLYQLTIEANTAFHVRAARGEKLTAASDPAADMFLLTQEIMRDAGLPAYEISNHAAPGQESRHNLTYWHYGDFIGIGPGAHGRYVDNLGQRVATAARKNPEAWSDQISRDGHGVQERTTIDIIAAQQEALMMGMRLATGIDRHSWRDKFGDDIVAFLPAAKLQRLGDEKLVTLTATHFTTTPDGAARLNALLRYLLN